MLITWLSQYFEHVATRTNISLLLFAWNFAPGMFHRKCVDPTKNIKNTDNDFVHLYLLDFTR